MRIPIARRLAPALYGLVLIGGLARCGEPTITENSGGGGGGGGTPAAVRLNITGQPSTTDVGTPISPPVRVVVADSNFLAVTSSSAPVTVRAIGSTNAPLVGTLTRNAVSGTAVMTGVEIDSVGSYRIIAESPGLISDTSDQFLVGLAIQNIDTVQIGSTAADTALQIVFRSQRNNTSNPAIDTIRVNGTIHWSWLGTRRHGVLINNGGLVYDSGEFQAPKELTLSIPTAGTYAYVCSVHGASMSGLIVVLP